MSSIPTTLGESSSNGLAVLDFGVFNFQVSAGKSFSVFNRAVDPINRGVVTGGSDYTSKIAISKYDADEAQSGFLSGAGAARRKIYEEAHDKFIDLANAEFFEYGYTPPSERYIADFAKSFPAILGELMLGISLSQAGNAKVMVALLNAVGSFRYEDVRPYGQVLAVAAISNFAVEVKEAAIRVYETWGHREGAKVLATVECPWPWLDEYRKQVIADIGSGT